MLTKAKTKLLRHQNTAFGWRILLFVGLFVIVSGTLGPRIIDNGAVGRDGFEVYGWAGKALLFGLLAFILLTFRNKQALTLREFKVRQLLWLLPLATSYLLANQGITHVLATQHSSGWVVVAHVAIVATVVFCLLLSFGWSNMRLLYQQYRKNLLIAFLLGICFTVFLAGVYALWQVLATLVLHSVAWLIRLTGLHVSVMSPQILLLDKFGIAISKYCSGIDSIALFGGLYFLIGVLDWRKLDHTKYLMAFIPAVIVLFGVNILRVYGLIMAGYYINPHIAFSLFHTYAGMLLFILYAGIFWKLSYHRLLKQNEIASKEPVS